ncbi:glucose/arabinose dehydrogenase [Pseudomonas duriflava]|uniref:Glucose/arabinose dehydrogenase n=1 Tax=Pseudomonas duriflava TaxID=459528 RepID=A0A562Q797_9PSED|nr:PQQ-dependent sugar dehydrogenase [Pseudomonas duriflava]TWI52599.1 glucose/arabinose dehydrogenase [Pseudomonas duriflava]
MTRFIRPVIHALSVALLAFSGPSHAQGVSEKEWPFTVAAKATFKQPWAMTFLPDGTLLVTEKHGALKHLDLDTGRSSAITGLPAIAYGGQGGLGDVILHPAFTENGWIYISYAEASQDGATRGAAVARAKLELEKEGSGRLSHLQVIWRQTPKVSGQGHYGHRLAFGPDGKLWISSGERQQFTPAQDMNSNLGKIIRINEDGSLPADNPFADQGGIAAQIWSLGHRNPLGIAFDKEGRLWEHEMGPKGGDEFNLIERGANYGYPNVSDGDHYSGRPIPDHSTNPEYIPPKISWTPVISPAGLIIYEADRFAQWKGNALMGGLSARSLIRLVLEGDQAREVERYQMDARIREVEQGPDGSLWVLEDGSDGRLLELQPK